MQKILIVGSMKYMTDVSKCQVDKYLNTLEKKYIWVFRSLMFAQTTYNETKEFSLYFFETVKFEAL